MQIYKFGKIVSIGKTYIIFEANNTGSIVYVPNIERFEKDKRIKLYLYKYSTDYSTATYGFNNFKERILFEDLIGLNGVGPKTAIGLLKNGHKELISMIVNGDVEALSSFPYLGARSANQMVFELADKYKGMEAKSSGKISVQKAISSLKTLGFNKQQIEYAVKNVTPQLTIELLVEESIKAISNAKFS